MKIKQKSTGRAQTLLVGVGIGVAIGFVIMLILSAIIAWMIGAEYLDEKSAGLGVIIIQLLSSVTGAWIAYALIKSRRLLVCLITGCGYCLLLLTCTALFFGGQYRGVGISLLAALAGNLMVGLVGLRGDKRQGINRRKIKNR